MTVTSMSTGPATAGERAADRVAREMVRIGRVYLRITCLVFSIYLSRRIFEYATEYPADIAWKMVALGLVSVVFGFGVALAEWRGKLPDRFVEPLLVLLGFFLTLNVFTNLFLTRDPDLLYNASYAMIAFGLSALSLRVWLAEIIPCLICFIAASISLGVFDPTHTMPPFAGGIGLSFVAFITRVPILKKRLELEAQLAADAEKLTQANLSKDRFLANMTHELRTPMTGVLGMLDLMAETKLDTNQKDMLETAQSSARYLLSVINDILDYSKLEAGKIKLRPEPTDPTQLTRDIVALFRAQAAQKGIKLVIDAPEAGAAVAALDPIRVAQVLLNLISNAVKYTEKGQVLVQLRLEGAGADAQLCWDVCDTGAGIPGDRIERLFERFEQLDDSAMRQQGTGLGLAIIRELVHLMDGGIRVESQLGVGSTFHFTLPYVAAHKLATLPERVEVQPPAVLAGRALRLLVAEDNPVSQKLIQKMLAREGWQVRLVGNGAEAVKLVIAEPDAFDIILMDVQMPVMDGMSATRQIHEKLASPPPIVALTANTMEQDVTAYLALGMKGVVGKPINRAELYQVMADAIMIGTRGRSFG